MPLPHIQNSEAGRNLYDPVHTSIFELYFTLPEALRAKFGKDEMLLTEHVLSISGLGIVHKGPEAGQQKFMGTDRSYLNPNIEGTHAELSVTLSLNLRNGVDNYIYKVFKAWTKVGHDILTGKRNLKKDYTANWLRACMANRTGDIIHDIVFKDIICVGGVDGMDEWNYDSNDAAQITVKFISDWFDDVDA